MIDLDEVPQECPMFRVHDGQYWLAAKPGDIVEGTLEPRTNDGKTELVLCFYPVGAEYLGEDPYMAAAGYRHRANLSQTATLEPLTDAAEEMLNLVLG